MAVAPVMAHDIEVVAVVEPVAPRCVSHRPSMPVRGDDVSEPYQEQVIKQGSRLPTCCIHATVVFGTPRTSGRKHSRDRLGGLIHEYGQVA